ncbi:MAG: hypothetical protein ACREQD_05615 [Candidatus Binataceae bacterium]
MTPVIYARTEGFDTADLIDAKNLLDELAVSLRILTQLVDSPARYARQPRSASAI